MTPLRAWVAAVVLVGAVPSRTHDVVLAPPPVIGVDGAASSVATQIPDTTSDAPTGEFPGTTPRATDGSDVVGTLVPAVEVLPPNAPTSVAPVPRSSAPGAGPSGAAAPVPVGGAGPTTNAGATGASTASTASTGTGGTTTTAVSSGATTSAAPASSASPTSSASPPAGSTTLPPTTGAPATATTTLPATAPPAPPAPTAPPAAPGSVLFATEFDRPGTGLDNGMVLPSYGPHLTPRPGVVARGALFRDPQMTEWEDVLLRAPGGQATGDRYLEAVVTVLANGTDAKPTLLFMDDPGTFGGGCAGGSTMDWAEVDAWNGGQSATISFVVDGCVESSGRVATAAVVASGTYTLRAELRGRDLTMLVDGDVVLTTTLPTWIGALPYGGLRLGQYGRDGGYDQYRIERFSYGTL